MGFAHEHFAMCKRLGSCGPWSAVDAAYTLCVTSVSGPFDQADLKVLLQQSAAGQKALKESFPKKEPRPKALPKAAVKKLQEGKAADAEMLPAKRHRGKTPAS